MRDYKRIETSVLLTMITAHAYYYGRVVTIGEEARCNIIICQLKAEIASRITAKQRLS